MTDLLTLIPGLKKAANTNGGEYHGPCPFCGGTDRLRAWPEPRNGDKPNWTCRQCGKGGDEINYIRYRDGVGYTEALRILGMPAPEPQAAPEVPAPEPTAPPCEAWRARMGRFVEWCAAQLWDDQHTYQDSTPLAYLRRRGLTDDTIRAANIGYNPRKFYRQCRDFGLDDDGKMVLPVGITIPTWIDGVLWQVAIRQPDSGKRDVRGSVKAPYGADSIAGDKPVLIVEGALDTLAIQQEAGDLCAAVAVGTTAARRTRWLFNLSRATDILVALDTDGPGQQAAHYWLDCFEGRARVWRPLWGDPAQMLQDGADVRAWVVAGLENYVPPEPERPRAELIDEAADWLLKLAQLTRGMQSEHMCVPEQMDATALTALIERVKARHGNLVRNASALRDAQEEGRYVVLAMTRAAAVVAHRNRTTRRAVLDEIGNQGGYEAMEGY